MRETYENNIYISLHKMSAQLRNTHLSHESSDCDSFQNMTVKKQHTVNMRNHYFLY